MRANFKHEPPCYAMLDGLSSAKNQPHPAGRRMNAYSGRADVIWKNRIWICFDALHRAAWFEVILFRSKQPCDLCGSNHRHRLRDKSIWNLAPKWLRSQSRPFTTMCVVSYRSHLHKPIDYLALSVDFVRQFENNRQEEFSDKNTKSNFTQVWTR